MNRTSLCLALCLFSAPALAQPKPTEDDYYRMITIPLPKDVVLEVGGLEWLDDDRSRLMACTRRGEVWLIDNPYADVDSGTQPPTFTRMLFGLHEPLGLLRRPDGIYTAQRSELTRLRDITGDDRIDEVTCINNDWEVSGNYHEYSFGPVMTKDGKFMITLNRPFGGGQEATAHWRGWAVTVDQNGKFEPFCPGLRSPAGLARSPDGEMFFTDNQGDWVPVCKISHLQYGKFQGNPMSLVSIDHPRSTMKNPGPGFPKSGLPYGEALKEMPQLVPPAVWFPYPEMGKSHSELIWDTTGGKFGPFENQIFIGDQGNAIVVRAFLEKVDGEYQGACFPFRKGFDSGILRLAWGKDGSLFCGGTNRGWGGGPKPYCLQRLVWTGKVPFEIHEMRAKPDGFEVTFTKPVDPQTASDLKSYSMRSWTYRYHSGYGDNPQDTQPVPITSVTVAPDGKSARVVVDGLKPAYVHELRLDGVRDRDGSPMLHPVGYYTLNRIPK